MLKLILLVILGLTCLDRPAEGLSCAFIGERPYCGEPSICPFGTGLDQCGFCPECLKGPGEVCGGLFNSEGVCGDDFYCKKDVPPGGVGDNIPGVCLPKKPENPIYFPSRFRRGLGSIQRAEVSGVQSAAPTQQYTPEHVQNLLLRQRGPILRPVANNRY